MTDSIIEALKIWKKEYIKTLITKLQPRGDVLQLGFHSSDAADLIQKFNPKSHTIIEGNPKNTELAHAWAKNHPNAKIIGETWQKALPSLKTFDTIFFEEVTPLSETDFKISFDFEDLHGSSTKAIEALSSLEKQIAEIKQKYSEEEVEKMMQQLGISFKTLLPVVFKPTKKPASKSNPAPNAEKGPTPPPAHVVTDPFLLFLLQCLESHVNTGCRISAYAELPISKYEDSRFFEQIITNPKLTYSEEILEIQIPQKEIDLHRKGLIFIIESHG